LRKPSILNRNAFHFNREVKSAHISVADGANPVYLFRMDLFAHIAYSATVCSQTGLAGGTKGSDHRLFADATAWWAVVFGLLPDALSMGFPLLFFWLSGADGIFFREMDGDAMVSYRYAHSLITALLVSGLIFLSVRKLLIPSLSWPLHLLMDMFTHGDGKYRTTLFYPLTDWGFDGISWWRHPWLTGFIWLMLPMIWLGLRRARRRRKFQ